MFPTDNSIESDTKFCRLAFHIQPYTGTSFASNSVNIKCTKALRETNRDCIFHEMMAILYLTNVGGITVYLSSSIAGMEEVT